MFPQFDQHLLDKQALLLQHQFRDRYEDANLKQHCRDTLNYGASTQLNLHRYLVSPSLPLPANS